MVKKGKPSKKKDNKENKKKIDKDQLPPPPPPPEEELGSAKLLDEPKPPGSMYKALDREGYDDGGVADLTLVIDLEDSVIRRKRGDQAYFTALRADLLPRVTTGNLAGESRRDQKVKLAKLLFAEDDKPENSDSTPTEVWIDSVDGMEDDEEMSKRHERLNLAKYALKLSYVLRESACCSLALSEISKRYVAYKGKDLAEAALRCSEKAVEIAGEGLYDNDEIIIEAEEIPRIHKNHEKQPTYNGLSHPESLKMRPLRVAHLCLRSAYLHMGNALSALGRDEEAREVYKKVVPLLQYEPRCGRVDWERSSIIVNVGNTYSRQGDFETANKYYDEAQKLGQDHLDVENGSKVDGYGMTIVAMRNRAFALKKAGKEDEAKDHMRKVLELQVKLNEAQEEQKELDKELQEKQEKLEEEQMEKLRKAEKKLEKAGML